MLNLSSIKFLCKASSAFGIACLAGSVFGGLQAPVNTGRAYLQELPKEYTTPEGKFDVDKINRYFKISYTEGGRASVKVRLAPRAKKHNGESIGPLPPLFLHQIDSKLLGKQENTVGQHPKNADFKSTEVFLYMPQFLVDLSETTRQSIFTDDEVGQLLDLREMLMPSFTCQQRENDGWGNSAKHERVLSCSQVFCASRSDVNLPNDGIQWGIPQIPRGMLKGERRNSESVEKAGLQFTFAKTNALVNHFDEDEKTRIHEARGMLISKIEQITHQRDIDIVRDLNHFLSHYYDGAFTYIYRHHTRSGLAGYVSQRVVGSCVLSPFPDERVAKKFPYGQGGLPAGHLPLNTDLPVDLPALSLSVLDSAPVTIPQVSQLSAPTTVHEEDDFGTTETSFDLTQSRHNYYGLTGQSYVVIIEPENFNPQSYNASVELVILSPTLDNFGAFHYFEKIKGGKIIAHPFIAGEPSSETAWE